MIKVGEVIGDALLYPLEPAYLGTWGYKAGLLRYVRLQGEGAPPTGGALTNSGRRHMYGGKNQILNVASTYTCAEILLFLY